MLALCRAVYYIRVMATIDCKICVIKSLKSKPGVKQSDFWDYRLRGFGIRVTSAGTKSWIVVHRVGGKQKRHTLGRYPEMGVAEARRRATAILQGEWFSEPEPNTALFDQNKFRCAACDHVFSIKIGKFAPFYDTWSRTDYQVLACRKCAESLLMTSYRRTARLLEKRKS